MRVQKWQSRCSWSRVCHWASLLSGGSFCQADYLKRLQRSYMSRRNRSPPAAPLEQGQAACWETSLLQTCSKLPQEEALLQKPQIDWAAWGIDRDTVCATVQRVPTREPEGAHLCRPLQEWALLQKHKSWGTLNPALLVQASHVRATRARAAEHGATTQNWVLGVRQLTP